MLTSIEKLNAISIVNFYEVAWVLLDLPLSPSFKPRTSPLVGAVSSSEIVILGGFSKGALSGDGYIYDVDKNSI